MLMLLLLRHAKAEPPAGGDDFARPLSARGERDATELGDFLAENRLRPDLALVSTAARTARTFELVAARVGPVAAIRHEAHLYNAGEQRIGDLIARVGAEARVVLVVGHNPGIMEVAVDLAREGDLAEIERLRGRFPPCGLAAVSFEAEDWAAACASGGRLDALVFPEDMATR